MKTVGTRILAVGAHPDDVEFMCAGLLTLLGKAGCRIHVAVMSLGDCGSANLGPEQIRSIREEEAESACKVIGAKLHPLEFRDFSIFNDDASNRRVTALIREIGPSVVITHPPEDYLADHETTSRLVRNACFYASAPNYDTSEWTARAQSLSIPYLYYAHPMEGIDIFGSEVVPRMYVDISSAADEKASMLSCHKSQRDWLEQQHGVSDPVAVMLEWSKKLGTQASGVSGHSVRFAEAYGQHRGHAYPKNNILAELLPGLVLPSHSPALRREPTG